MKELGILLRHREKAKREFSPPTAIISREVTQSTDLEQTILASHANKGGSRMTVHLLVLTYTIRIVIRITSAIVLLLKWTEYPSV